jgi:CRP/FNR family transcriptional regulator, nitrogen oxide reductase regulator
MTIRRSTPLKPENVEPDRCSLDLRLKILGQLPFFSRLQAEEIDQVNESFHEYGYTPGESIYFAGEPAERLYVVAAGKVKLLRHTLAGQDVLLDILAPGEFFGALSILGQEEYPDTAQAQTACCVLAVAAQDFQAILYRYPAVAVTTLNIVSQRLKAAHDTIRQLSAFPVEQRLAAVLLKLAEKLGERRAEGLLIQAPLSRQDLAEMTGTTPETASRILSQFQKDGLIHSGRQWIAIIDRDRLSAIASGGP